MGRGLPTIKALKIPASRFSANGETSELLGGIETAGSFVLVVLTSAWCTVVVGNGIVEEDGGFDCKGTL